MTATKKEQEEVMQIRQPVDRRKELSKGTTGNFIPSSDPKQGRKGQEFDTGTGADQANRKRQAHP